MVNRKKQWPPINTGDAPQGLQDVLMDEMGFVDGAGRRSSRDEAVRG
jgi:hypothetical protein